LAIHDIHDAQIHIDHCDETRPETIGARLFENCLVTLLGRGLLEHPEALEDTYGITAKGLTFVEEELTPAWRSIEQEFPEDNVWAARLLRETTASGEHGGHDFENFKMALLSTLADASGLGKSQLADLADSAKLEYLLGWIGQVGEELQREGLADVEINLDHGPDHVLAQITEKGRHVLESVSVGVAVEEDSWAPLKIEREAREYKEAVAATEDAIKIVEGDNGYAVKEPEERKQILWSLMEGLTAITEWVPIHAQVRSMLIGPLRFLSKRFGDSAMGAAAQTALVKLVDWLSVPDRLALCKRTPIEWESRMVKLTIRQIEERAVEIVR
jgi:DNA-binding PadR family transcriptional regulator